jgi:thiol:disulfide interchange protein DsbC
MDEAGRLLDGVGKVVSVRHSPVRGLFEVSLESQGKQGVAYVDFAKKHLIPGPVFSLATKKPVNDGQQSQQQKPTKVDINSLPVKNSIVLGNPDGKKKLFVFTDPDCPFCSKLHMELVKLVYMEPDLGIFVKMFPLKMHPGAYDKARVILGGDSPYLLNKAFAGEQLPAATEKDRKEPVDETIKLGESLGITGTPTLVLPDGRIVSGYREADKIKKLINGATE